MKSWHLISPGELKPFEAAELPAPTAEEARIKISNVLLDSIDLSVYKGTSDVAYPLIPGRYAVGKITQLPESYQGMLEKGDRVFINPHFPNKNFTGDSTPLQGMDSTKIAGVTANGFLVPAVNVMQNNLYVLPESVSDASALYVYLVALALSAVDNLGDLKGKYIAVFGATALGIILCRILEYYQAVPILIDSRTARLDFARSTGVTYAFLNDDGLDSHINDITGASFCDGSVYVPSGSSIVNTAIFRVTAPRKSIVFCGFAHTSLQANLNAVLQKELHIQGVGDPSENLSSAINLLANKAVLIDPFTSGVYNIDNLPQAYADAQTSEEDRELPHERMSIIDCFGKL